MVWSEQRERTSYAKCHKIGNILPNAEEFVWSLMAIKGIWVTSIGKEERWFDGRKSGREHPFLVDNWELLESFWTYTCCLEVDRQKHETKFVIPESRISEC